jgi:NADH-quinone oxidoreductase subunit N
VNLHELVSQLIIDTKGVTGSGFPLWSADSSLGAFLPELCLCATIVAMLFARLFSLGRRIDSAVFVLVGTACAIYVAAPWEQVTAAGQAAPRMEIFTGMLVYDPFTIFMRNVLIGFAFLFTIFTKLSGIPDREDGADIYTLVLGSTLGMCLMASANHLLMVFMAVEMASVPSYVLAGLLKGRRVSSEAALKYSIYGAGAAGVMLYGISLVAGLLHTAHLPTLAVKLSESLPLMGPAEQMVLALGGLMIAVGLSFKLAAVPFHFWCPDVFEGACAEVNAFLSVASKAAALALLVRVAIGFGAIPPAGEQPGMQSVAVLDSTATEVSFAGGPSGLFAVADEHEAAAHGEDGHGSDTENSVSSNEGPLQNLAPSREFIGMLIAFLATITCTFGNLAAYGQTNIKRLLAYSTIAHAGYMMMPVAAVMVMAGHDALAAERAVGSLLIYIVVYLFMNLGAFAIVAFLRNAMHSEEIADYGGLIKRCPITAVCFIVILFSLVGLPPFAGFIGKFAIFASLVEGYEISKSAGSPAMYLLVLLAVGGINTAISLFYYLRVARVMTIDGEPADRPPLVFSDVSLQTAFVWLVTAPTVLLLLDWDLLNEWARAASRHLLS